MEAGEGGPQAGQPQMSEAEVREKLEEELRKVRIEDLLMQSVAGVVNLTARRIVKEDERDLAQAKIGIDATTALLDFLPEQAAKQVRDALAELQVLYAKAAAGEPLGAPEPGGEAAQEPEQPQQERPSGLWTPPGT